jgi:hypothetical protein
MGDHVIEASEIQFEDKCITCSDCGATFIFSAGEQKFFADKELYHPRKRCRECNAKKSERIKRAKITTDGWRGYYKLPEIIKEHKRLTVPQKQAHKLLPWVHTAISNAKRLLLGTHHSIGKSYLQNYLNEFCYKLNRRYVDGDLFEHMMTVSVSQKWFN